MIKQAPQYRTALLLILLVAAPVLGQSGGEFTPLIGSAGLERFVGDRRYWSFAGGVLASRVDGSRTSSALILSTERLGNFILKFKARGGEVRVVFRASIQPPGQVLGYEAEVGGQRPGNLTARKPAAWAPRLGPGGMPARLEMPFLREASDRWATI